MIAVDLKTFECWFCFALAYLPQLCEKDLIYSFLAHVMFLESRFGIAVVGANYRAVQVHKHNGIAIFILH
jgi:hypothetical protein